MACGVKGVDEDRGRGRGPRTETESLRYGEISRKEEPEVEEMRPVRRTGN